MGFSFGFTEDIDIDEDESVKVQEDDQYSTNPLDSTSISELHPPHKISFIEMLNKIKDVRISCESLNIQEGEAIYKRELYDVKHQLMMEDESEINTNGEFEILLGDTEEDLRAGVYEGGLKSWECSFDLINKLNQIDNLPVDPKDGCLNVVELGCGTSLPSLFLFQKILKARKEQAGTAKVKLVLTDYNYHVLRLVTVPNLLLTYVYSRLTPEQIIDLQTETSEQEGMVREGEIIITSKLIQYIQEDLQKLNISIELISGSWNREFMNILNSTLAETPISATNSILLTSETIYSLDVLPLICEILLESVGQFHANNFNLCLLAAKDIYFGVGGSIKEVETRFDERIAGESEKYQGLQYTVDKVESNLRRSVINLYKSV